MSTSTCSQHEWNSLKRNVLTDTHPLFSFVCGGVSSRDKPGGWPAEQHTYIHGQVRMTCESRIYTESDCIEWRVVLKNMGSQNSPVLEDLLPLDLALEVPPGGIPSVFSSSGCGDEMFMINSVVLQPGTNVRLSNKGGGKTGQNLPFFNVDIGGRGIMGAVGWPGRWMIEIERQPTGLIALRAGLEKARLLLRPGEAIVLPSILLMFWEGDRLAAHNRWRQHLLAHHSPVCAGEPIRHLLCLGTWGGMKTGHHLSLIETVRQKQLPFDCYWIDAGWYGPEHETEEYQSLLTEDWFFYVGDWRANQAVHPRGLRPISDAAHAAGMKFLLWFEPERAVVTSPLVREHSEWFFKRINEDSLVGRTCHWRCFNFGIPEARQWMTDWIGNRIEELGIDVFRQDCNFWPADSWDDEDGAERVGMSEIRYVEGLLAFWDKLRARFPHLVLDIVQRRDLASISRGLDLTRSDPEVMPHADPRISQVALHCLSYWTPLSGTGTTPRPGQDYDTLSALSPSLVMGLFRGLSDVPVIPEPPADYPWDWLRRILETERRAWPFLLGDYYPLLAPTVSTEHWSACQFHRPDLDAGLVLTFRRQESPYVKALFPLCGLSLHGQYYFSSHAELNSRVLDAEALTQRGLEVELDRRGCAVWFYEKVRE